MLPGAGAEPPSLRAARPTAPLPAHVPARRELRPACDAGGAGESLAPPASSLTARLCSSRRSLLKARAMDLITSTATLPLLFGCVGVFGLLKLLQWLRTRAYVRDAVVVITGATSGLGRGGSRGPAVRVQHRGRWVTWPHEHVAVLSGWKAEPACSEGGQAFSTCSEAAAREQTPSACGQLPPRRVDVLPTFQNRPRFNKRFCLCGGQTEQAFSWAELASPVHTWVSSSHACPGRALPPAVLGAPQQSWAPPAVLRSAAAWVSCVLAQLSACLLLCLLSSVSLSL